MNDKVWVKIKCSNYYKVIKKIESFKINIYEIKKDDNYIYILVLKSGYKILKKYLVTYDISLYKNTGISKTIEQVNKRKIFIICILLGIILLFIISKMILKIEIVHESKEIREIIKEELDENKIKVLSFKKSYKDLEKIKQKILDKYPTKLDWLEFEIDGLIFRVRIEQRIITNINKSDKVCNIVALKDGMVKDILIKKGEGKVNYNDYVRKGDILISGNISDEVNVCASGTVYGEVYYTGSASIPLTYYEDTLSGDYRYNLTYEVNSNKTNIFKNRLDTFNSSYKKILEIFDFKLYLERQESVKRKRKTYTKEEAINKGISKVEEAIKKKIDKNSTILVKKVLKKVENNSTIDIEVFIVVKELISTVELIEE